jgi:hypothetical protein
MRLENSPCSARSLALFLALFEECCGEFLGYRICDDRIVVRLRREWSIALPFSLEFGRILRDLKAGDQIGVLRTNDDAKPIRVRRLKTR